MTLRAVECAGGCGWGTVVVVDGRYKEPVKVEDVPRLLEEIRSGGGSTEPPKSAGGGSATAGAGNDA